MIVVPAFRWIPGSFGHLLRLQLRLMYGSVSTILLGFVTPIVLLVVSGYIDSVIAGSEFLASLAGFSGFAIASIHIVNGLIVMPQVFLRQRRSGMLKLYRVSPFGFTEIFGAYWLAATIMTLSATLVGLALGAAVFHLNGGYDWGRSIALYGLQVAFGAVVLFPLGFAMAGYFRSAVGTALSGAGTTIMIFAVPILETGLFSVQFFDSLLSNITGGEASSVGVQCTVVMSNLASSYYVGLGTITSTTLRDLLATDCNGFGPWQSLVAMGAYAVFGLILMRMSFRWE